MGERVNPPFKMIHTFDLGICFLKMGENYSAISWPSDLQEFLKDSEP